MKTSAPSPPPFLHHARFFGFVMMWSLAALSGGRAQNVTTYRYDNSKLGLNPRESLLTPANVRNTTFGKLFDQALDGQVYAQPLYLAGVNIPGQGFHNVVFVATMHDSVYAFDADKPLRGPTPHLWKTSFISPAVEGEVTTIPQQDVISGDISVEVGILSTPVIDETTGTLYVLARTKETRDGHAHFVQKLHALDVATGREKFGGPGLIADTICDTPADRRATYIYVAGPSSKGTGIANVSGVIPFNALRSNQRASLTLLDGVVYATWSSHSDVNPYHGMLIGFDARTLAAIPGRILNVTRDGEEGGIWQGGCGPSVDAAGNLYIAVGNGDYDGKANWGECFLKISTLGGTLKVTDSFTPSDYKSLNGGDRDLGSSGLALLPELKDSRYLHLMIGGGKSGLYYVVNRDDMGRLEGKPHQLVQLLSSKSNASNWAFATPVFFKDTLYFNTSGEAVNAIHLDHASGKFAGDITLTRERFNSRGGGPVITANGTENGVLWIVAGKLYAYDADELAQKDSSPIFTDNLPKSVAKFTAPMVTHGKAYVAANGLLRVYGLLDTPATPPAAPSDLRARSTSPQVVSLAWKTNSTNEAGFVIERSQANTDYAQIGIAGAHTSSFDDKTTSANTAYHYRIAAINSQGTSAYAPPATITSAPYVSERGLVACWPLNEGTGPTTLDFTGNGHQGTLVGEISWIVGPPGPNAVNLHGTGNALSHIAVADTADLRYDSTQSFTITAMARPASVLDHWAGIVAKSREAATGGYGLYINPANQWTFRAGNGGAGDLSGGTPKLAWQQVIAVQDGKTGARTLYVNGNKVASGQAQDGSGAGDLWIGQGNAPQEGFPGDIDDVRIYNRALDPSEFTRLPTIVR